MLKWLIIGILFIGSKVPLYAQVSTVMTPSDSIMLKQQLLEKSGNYISTLDLSVPIEGVVGLKSPGATYAIIIDRVEITEMGGIIDVSAAIPIPGSDRPLCFRARGIQFSATGGITGRGRLELVSEISMTLSGGLTIVVPRDGKTFVEFDCDGFKQLGLSADIIFDSNYIEPAGSGAGGGVVKAHLETVVQDANDITASISIEPFRVRGLDGYVFTVREASLDQSDFVNPSGFVFPANYSGTQYANQPTLWRGVYIKRVEVALPSYLGGSSKTPVSISADNLLYDDMGLSGIISANSVLPLERGEIEGGFALSIGRVALEFSQNELVRGAMEGSIKLPISSKDTLSYAASADASGRFTFTAAPTRAISFDVWKAKASILPSSIITIGQDDNGIVVRTLLNGKLTVEAPVAEGSGKTLKMKAPFEELYLSNRAPYFEVKAFGIENMDTGMDLAGFNFSISSIGFSSRNSRSSLTIGIDLVVGGSGSNTISAGGVAVLMAERERSGWVFKRLVVENLNVSTEFSGFKLTGGLVLFNDSPQYGDGIGGNIKMELKLLKFELGAVAVFGSVDGFKYWYADAFSTTKIPVGTGLMITSLGGGAFTRMSQGVPEKAKENYGKGSSGISYVPDKNIGFGFMARVGLASSDGNIINGMAALEMAFNSSGGVAYISFLGQAQVMATKSLGELAGTLKEQAGTLAKGVEAINKVATSVNKGIGKEVLESTEGAVDLKKRAEAVAKVLEASSKKAPITATLFAIFDFNKGSFFAKLEARVDAAGIIRGTGDKGKAGEMVMYFGPDKWYVHCGTPTTPIGIELLGLARLKSYFMMGHEMPAFPDPPQRVLDVIGLDNIDRSRDISSLAGGRGIAFGASLDVDTGNIQFLMFYARLAAGIGFDVMLKNFGTASCAGEGETLGINGWYAMGKAWAYVEGEIGIRVKMMFIKGQFPILKIGVGALLEAQLPNPSWFHGAVGGYYNILGGLVKGRCKFEFELGKKCKIKSSAKDLLANMNLISDLRPSDGASEVSVFSKPQVVLSMPAEKSFEIDAPDGQRYKFRAKIDRFVALNGGEPVTGVMQMNDDSTVITIKPHSILPEKRSMTVSCELSFEEFRSGRWVKVTDEGRPVTEAKAVTFTTGGAPDYIPEDNVVIEYPVRGQQAFYRNEHAQGFVVLDAWQDNLFSNMKFKPYALFKTGDRVVAKTAITTSYSSKRISFEIPQSLLANATGYKLVLVNEATDKDTGIDKNIEKSETAVTETEGDIGEMSITTRRAKEDLVIAEDKELYTVTFRTSMYDRFSDKVAASSRSVYARFVTSTIAIPVLQYSVREPFESLEKSGSRQTNDRPLVQISSDLSGNSWYRNEVGPYIYDGYPFLGVGTVDRQADVLGVPPYKAVRLEATSDYIMYELPLVMVNDYYFIRNSVSSLYLRRQSYSDTDRARIEHLISNIPSDFKSAKGEQLPLKVRYVLPDGTVTTELDLSFTYFINN